MVEILCTITGVVAGVAIVASLMHSKGDAGRWLAPPSDQRDEQRPGEMRGIAEQLRLLTFRVAADVTAHNERVEAISGRLHEPQSDQPEHVLSAINELIAANEQMQCQLAETRKRIADQSELIEEAVQSARTDALTGLPNQRALHDFLQTCLDAIRPGESAGLLLLDVDHFKAFNETYGHTTGDAVLAAFARNIRKSCKEECYAARYGDAQFAVILTGRDAATLALKSAALRKYVSEQSIGCGAAQLKITASAGLCTLAADDTLESTYARADEGLQRAKKSGGNQGYWLNGSRWQPFPAPAELGSEPGPREKVADAQTLIRQTALATKRQGEKSCETELQHDKVGRALANAPEADSLGGREVVSAIDGPATFAKPNHGGELHKKALGEVLDLTTFMNRTGVYFEQLRRADLPATGMLVEAQWDMEMTPADSKACWDTVLGLLQAQLRGIDVVCIYRANTAGVFLPGCSMEAASERASRIQMLLENSRDQWEPAEHCPDRLSISIAQALEHEDTGQFLQRLEEALEEAAGAGRFELVLHNGKSTRLESTISA